jgi:glycosyltransferase involved in cell wall biosynthesis
MKIISSVTSDLYSDQRVHRICETLRDEGHEIILVGRKKRSSPELSPRKYQTKRLKLIFEKGPLFYLEFNMRLFFFVLFRKCDVLLSNDLDTLLANTLVASVRGKKLYYDSHEYFTEVPELVGRPGVRKMWKFIESVCIKRVNIAFTVSESIARSYTEKYGLNFAVIRNLPIMNKGRKGEVKSEYNLRDNEDQKIIIYQGSVNVDRGLEEMIDAMENLENVKLIILGDGDVMGDLKEKVRVKALEGVVVFLGRVEGEKLHQYTAQGDLGISIEKRNGLSYTYALPNKFFDYIQAGIPSLISDLPEMIQINDKYQVAEVLSSHNPNEMAGQIKSLLQDTDRLNTMKSNTERAASELNWEMESKNLIELFSS